MVYYTVPAIPTGVITVSENIADHTTPTQFLAVNADGSLNTTEVAVNVDSIVLIASAAKTTNVTVADQTNLSYKGIIIYITPGAFGASASTIVVTLQGKDPVSGTTYTILASASLVASTPVALTVYPGLTAAANVAANAILPKTWALTATAVNWGTGGSTLGVSCALLR